MKVKEILERKSRAKELMSGGKEVVRKRRERDG
jgi:hypothetical protein